jgi:hypothetical protein
MNVQIQAAEIARIADMLAPLCDDDDTLFADMMEGESDLFAIVSRLHGQIASDEELLAGITERQAHLAERKRRLSDRVTATMAAIGKFLRAATLPKIELPEATYSVRDGKPTLRIVDPDAVPDGFRKIKSEPNKTAINEVFVEGHELPNWLVREPARDVVTMRTK